MTESAHFDHLVEAVLSYTPRTEPVVGSPAATHPLSYYEFFAGGGMVRAGLGRSWKCLFANDFDLKKSAIYKANWGSNGELNTNSVDRLTVHDLPGRPSLAWASFPCQDLSLAGMGAGLKGDRSGTFWPFWKLIEEMRIEQRAPRIVVLENVCGALTSHGGKDFSAIVEALSGADYDLGALVVNASTFVPQSRPRLFVIAVASDQQVPVELVGTEPAPRFHNRTLLSAYDRLETRARERWIWWNIPAPRRRRVTFADLIEDDPPDVRWHTDDETRRLLSMMSAVNLKKVETAQREGRRLVGSIYKRTRRDKRGRKVQRAEVRFDGIAGCLRTPAGGSSRQLVMIVDGDSVRSRLISSRETARLMGLPEKYTLPENYNEAYHLTGDGVVVPVVRHLARCVFEPILLA